MTHLRPAAVAGAFYPGDAGQLSRTLDDLLAEARRHTPPKAPPPKAIIAPHAGYVYSGPVAARAYARLAPLAGRVTRVVLLGPAHRVAFRGMALPTVDAFATPLGPLRLDRAAIAGVVESVPGCGYSDQAHAEEHSLEVHLPFLRAVLGDVALVPVCVGEARPEDVAALLDHLWGGLETLIVVSTDLSHYLDYDTGRRFDADTRTAIETLDAAALSYDRACGRTPMGGLLLAARARGLSIETLDVRSSGDTAGPRDRVVGYGAWALVEPQADGSAAAATEASPDPETAIEAMLARHGADLIALARHSIENGLTRGEPLAVDPATVAEPLRHNGACFVTLTVDGALRGCIGSPQAWRPLAQDVAENAWRSAFHDPRFPPVSAREWPAVAVALSVLTPPQPFPVRDEDDLVARLRPGVDGLILGEHGARGLFLPAVWETLPDPREFVRALKRKAGLPPGHWSDAITLERFAAKSVKG